MDVPISMVFIHLQTGSCGTSGMLLPSRSKVYQKKTWKMPCSLFFSLVFGSFWPSSAEFVVANLVEIFKTNNEKP